MAITEDAVVERAAAVVGGGCGGASEIRAAILSGALGAEIDGPELQPGGYFVGANFTVGGYRGV